MPARPRHHRYLASPQSSVPTVLSALRERAVAACRGRRVVAVQDTTAVSFGEAGGRHGLGPGGDGRHPGFFLHPVVAVDAQDEAVLGLVLRRSGRAGRRRWRCAGTGA